MTSLPRFIKIITLLFCYTATEGKNKAGLRRKEAANNETTTKKESIGPRTKALSRDISHAYERQHTTNCAPTENSPLDQSIDELTPTEE